MKKFLVFAFLFILIFLLLNNANVTTVLYKNPNLSIEERVNDLLSRMTLEEKIGQMAQIDSSYIIEKSDITKFGIGSILSGGGSKPADINANNWANFYDTLQRYALKSRLGIPLIYGIDAIHGHNKVRGATIFPHNIGLGATRNPELVEKIGEITAMEVSCTGIDWTFSPCIAVPQDERWGRTYEGFGEDPELVSILGDALIKGYQGNDFSNPYSICATAKHFAGDGGTKNGIDQYDTILSEEEFRRIHIAPYISAIKNNVGSIMVSFSSWNGEKNHGNKHLLTDILKSELGFKGILVSDWGGIRQLPGEYSDQIQNAVNAGIDMAMLPDNYNLFISSTLDLVKYGKISMDRINDAVKRILTIKFKLGLFEKPFANRKYMPTFGSKNHRKVARDAVRQSLVLLKNNKILPLKKDIKAITIIGAKSDDIGSQCGGWTMNWQGETGNNTAGTTILTAIKNAVSPGTSVLFSEFGDDIKKSNVIIAVIGENPYAEFQGDKMDLSLSDMDLGLLIKAYKTKIPLIVILLSGRPLIVTDEINKWNAFIAAWLPGTEAEGIADVIFGDYKPTAKLPCTWPKDMSQIPINNGDGKKDPLFPYGFGLTY